MLSARVALLITCRSPPTRNEWLPQVAKPAMSGRGESSHNWAIWLGRYGPYRRYRAHGSHGIEVERAKKMLVPYGREGDGADFMNSGLILQNMLSLSQFMQRYNLNARGCCN